MLAEHWMEEHGVKPLQLSPADARTQLFAWLKPRWEENAVLYLQKKLPLLSSSPRAMAKDVVSKL